MLAAACSKSEPQTQAKGDGSARPVAHDVIADAMPVDAAAAPRKVFLHGASRCGECHEKMFDEWTTSAHAKAATSEMFKAASAEAKDPACAKCHTPLAADVPKDIINEEGVTCDVCHALRDPKPAPTGAGFRLAIDDMVKYGPRCDLKDHYFHRMGCSPEHEKSELCGSCHWWEPKGLPVFTEYADWKAGPAAAKGQQCQDCHMPKTRAALAVGAPVRDGVPDHGQLGETGDLMKTALALKVTVADSPEGSIAVHVTLTNVGAGHPVPAGLPERAIQIRVRVREGSAEPQLHSRIAIGRSLVDDAGKEVPFWRATKAGGDSRIAPGQSYEYDDVVPPPSGKGSIEVDVVHLSVVPALAAAFGVDEPAEMPMVRASVPLPAPRAGKHANLPKTVTVAPATAAKRKGKK